jgi:hypothetical protein
MKPIHGAASEYSWLQLATCVCVALWAVLQNWHNRANGNSVTQVMLVLQVQNLSR